MQTVLEAQPVLKRLSDAGRSTASRSAERIYAGQEILDHLINHQIKSASWRNQVSFIINGLRSEGKDGLIGVLSNGAIDTENYHLINNELDTSYSGVQKKLFCHSSPLVGAIAIIGKEGATNSPLYAFKQSLDKITETIESIFEKEAPKNDIYRSHKNTAGKQSL